MNQEEGRLPGPKTPPSWNIGLRQVTQDLQEQLCIYRNDVAAKD